MKNIPEIKVLAYRLILICLAIILLCVICVCLTTESPSPLFVLEAVQSALAATVISLGGGLLLDCEIRHAEGKN